MSSEQLDRLATRPPRTVGIASPPESATVTELDVAAVRLACIDRACNTHRFYTAGPRADEARHRE